MKIGILGCGAISRVYGEAIASIADTTVYACDDYNPKAAAALAASYKGRAFEHFEEMLKSDVELVCICTPSGLHAQQAVAAASAGKHIMCEKPIGITMEQLDMVGEAVERNGICFSAVSQLLYSDAVRQTKDALTQNKLGQLILADLSMKYYRSAEYYSSGSWRGTWQMDGGGALMNQGIHGISVLLHLLGPVKSVRGLARTLVHDIEVEDTAGAMIEFENGAVGSIIGTTSIMPALPRTLNIHGTKGSIEVRESSIARWEVPGEEGQNVMPCQDITTANEPMSMSCELHKRQLLDCINAIQKGGSPLSDYQAGRQTVELILAVYQASKSGNVVAMPS